MSDVDGSNLPPLSLFQMPQQQHFWQLQGQLLQVFSHPHSFHVVPVAAHLGGFDWQ